MGCEGEGSSVIVAAVVKYPDRLLRRRTESLFGLQFRYCSPLRYSQGEPQTAGHFTAVVKGEEKHVPLLPACITNLVFILSFFFFIITF